MPNVKVTRNGNMVEIHMRETFREHIERGVSPWTLAFDDSGAGMFNDWTLTLRVDEAGTMVRGLLEAGVDPYGQQKQPPESREG